MYRFLLASCRVLLLLLISTFSLPGLLLAQSEDIVTAFFDDEIPLILTTSRLNKTQANSPASVSIIDRKMIEASGARYVSDIFRLVPGFIVGNYNGTSPVVTYHGLGRRFQHQLQLLIDGRSVFIPSFGGIAWTNLPLQLEDIERIEVNRGPNAVTYGANSFLASINIITRHAAEDFGVGYSLTQSLDSDSDITDAYVRLGNQHENIDWRLSLGSQTDDGFPDGPKSRHFDSRNVKKINFRTDIHSASNQTLTLQLGLNRTEAGRGDASTSTGEEHPEDILRDENTDNSFQSVQWESTHPAYSNHVLLTHTNHKAVDHFDTEPFTFEGVPNVSTTLNLDRESDRIDFEAFHNREINSSFQFVVGGGVRQDKVRSMYVFNDNKFHDISVERLHGNVEWRPVKNWLLDIGAVVEESDLTDRDVSPRISLLHNLSSQHSLRLVHSVARRNPVMYEKIGHSVLVLQTPALGNTPIPVTLWHGDPDFVPEKNTSVELGLHSEFQAEGLSTDIKLFEYKITHQLQTLEGNEFNPILSPLLGENIDFQTVDNSGATRVKGLDIAFNYSPDAHRYRIYAGMSVTDVTSRDDEVKLTFPDKTAFLSGYYQLSTQHTLSASFYYVDEMKWLDTNRDTPITRKLDLRYQFVLNNADSLKLEVVAQNVLDDFLDYRDEQFHQPRVFIRLTGNL